MSVKKIVEGIRNFIVGDNPVYQDPNGGPVCAQPDHIIVNHNLSGWMNMDPIRWLVVSHNWFIHSGDSVGLNHDIANHDTAWLSGKICSMSHYHVIFRDQTRIASYSNIDFCRRQWACRRQDWHPRRFLNSPLCVYYDILLSSTSLCMHKQYCTEILIFSCCESHWNILLQEDTDEYDPENEKEAGLSEKNKNTEQEVCRSVCLSYSSTWDSTRNMPNALLDWNLFSKSRPYTPVFSLNEWRKTERDFWQPRKQKKTMVKQGSEIMVITWMARLHELNDSKAKMENQWLRDLKSTHRLNSQPLWLVPNWSSIN